MSRKRPAGQIQSSQMLEIACKLSPGSTFTDGSIEALRRCQSNFLDQLSHQLITLDKFTYTPADVQKALENMGMTDIAQEACYRQQKDSRGIPPPTTTPNTCLGNTDQQDPTSSTHGSVVTTTNICTTLETTGSKTATRTTTTTKRGRKKKVMPKWSQELEDEQERLLAQTKRDMDEKHGDAEGENLG